MDTTNYWKLPRLYCDQKIAGQDHLTLDKDQTHYLKNVMRRSEGDLIRIFDGQSGEYITRISQLGKKETLLEIDRQIKPQPTTAERTHLLFAPIIKNRMDILIEKIVELGVTDIHPVITARTEYRKIKTDRLLAQIIEAAEQCERLVIPQFHPEKPLETVASQWSQTPTIQWCAERESLKRKALGYNKDKDQAFLVGPAGGFEETEQDFLQSLQHVTPISLGETILRAETASILCLASRKLENLQQ